MSGIEVKMIFYSTYLQHPQQHNAIENTDHRHPSAFMKRFFILTVCRHKLNNPAFVENSDIPDSNQNLANNKEAHGQQHSIREKRPRKSVGFPKRSKQHSRNDLRNDHPQKDSHRHREYEQEKSLSKKEQSYGFLLHSQGCLNCKLRLFFSQHETIDIVDQEQQKQTNPANCQFHTSSQQGNIIFRTNGRMIMGAADRQKRIEQGDTECHGHNINQIVLHRPLCIFENKFSVHRSCPLPSW